MTTYLDYFPTFTDYFQRVEFRLFSHDTGATARYSDADIDAAQAEVITTLESWAGSAWPTIQEDPEASTGAMVADSTTLTSSGGLFQTAMVGHDIRVVGAGAGGADLHSSIVRRTNANVVVLADAASTAVATADLYIAGDGVGVFPRRFTETRDADTVGLVFLSRRPVLDVVTFTDGNDEAYDSESYSLYPEEGYIRFAGPSSGRRIYAVTYDYGFLATPAHIKRPAMKAAKSLLDSEAGSGRRGIPSNVNQTTTEATTFLMSLAGAPIHPWPWDREASEAVSRYWGRYRHRRFAGV